MTGDRYRGRTTRQRNVAEKVAREWAERRAAKQANEQELDLEKASVDAEVELLDPAARPEPRTGGVATAVRPKRPAAARARGQDRVIVPWRRPARAGPGRPPEAAPRHRRVRLAARAARRSADVAPGQHGKHVGLTSVPHGAKSYLAAALALAPDAERICWVARDAEIGDRVAEELGAWLGDPALVAILEPRTSLAYERSELVPDETAARVAALAAWRSGAAKVLVASVQALVQATIAPDDLPVGHPHPQAGRADRPRPADRRAVRARLLARDRGRRPGRVRATRRHRRRVPAVGAPARPDRAVRRRDRLPARLRPHRPTQRRAPSARSPSCPPPSSCCRPAART